MSADDTRNRQRYQAADALRRARRLPVGAHRNDLRQLAIALKRLAAGHAPNTGWILPEARIAASDDEQSLRKKAEWALHRADTLPDGEERQTLHKIAAAFHSLAREHAWLKGKNSL